jgi:hypothetical protein
MVEVVGRQQSQHKTIENNVRLLHTKQNREAKKPSNNNGKATPADGRNIARTEHLKKTWEP